MVHHPKDYLLKAWLSINFDLFRLFYSEAIKRSWPSKLNEIGVGSSSEIRLPFLTTLFSKIAAQNSQVLDINLTISIDVGARIHSRLG